MNYNIGEYIGSLIARAGLSQADVAREINVSRQSLSYIICGKREMSLQLSMKLEAYFSLPDGELMKIQAIQAVQQRKRSIRNHLCNINKGADSRLYFAKIKRVTRYINSYILKS